MTFARKSGVYTILLFFAVVYGIPYFFMLTTAFKTPQQVLAYPLEWLPNPIVLRNIPEVWRLINFPRALLNSVIITFSTTLGTLFACYTTAFGFARINFKGRTFFFALVLATMMLPPQVTYIPLFVILQKIGWINTFRPFYVPAFLGGGTQGGVYIFLLRQFLLTIPRDFDDAARIDGCSTFGMYWRIFLPLTKPALVSVGILSFVFNWNNYFGPLVFINSNIKKPLTLAIALLKDQQGAQQYNLVMMGACLTVIPCIVIFLLLQRYFVRGITMSGIKG
jgi:multiple sugar transport system permease protein